MWGRASSHILTHPRKRKSRGVHQAKSRRPVAGRSRWSWWSAWEATRSPATLAAAVDNALRTVLAMTAMDEKRAQGRSRIISHRRRHDRHDPGPTDSLCLRGRPRAPSTDPEHLAWCRRAVPGKFRRPPGGRSLPPAPGGGIRRRRDLRVHRSRCREPSRRQAPRSPAQTWPPARSGRPTKWTATSPRCWPWQGFFGPVSSQAGSRRCHRRASKRGADPARSRSPSNRAFPTSLIPAAACWAGSCC